MSSGRSSVIHDSSSVIEANSEYGVRTVGWEEFLAQLVFRYFGDKIQQ